MPMIEITQAQADGAAFKARLRKLGISQIELAKRFRCSPPTISDWITGRTRIPGSALAYLALIEIYEK